MAQAGYDPREAVPFWERMSGCPKQMIDKLCFRSQQAIPEFLSTHPSDVTRINQIEAWLPEALQHFTVLMETPSRRRFHIDSQSDRCRRTVSRRAEIGYPYWQTCAALCSGMRKGGEDRPLAQLKGLSGFLSQEQKHELIRKVTDAIVSVEGEGVRPVTWVILEEVPSGQWGAGGTPVMTDALKQMAAQGK